MMKPPTPPNNPLRRTIFTALGFLAGGIIAISMVANLAQALQH